MKNFLTLAGVIIVGAFLVFIYDCIAGLADFAGRIRPEFTPFVFWGLLIPTTATFGWWLAMALMLPKPIMVHANPGGQGNPIHGQAGVHRHGRVPERAAGRPGGPVPHHPAGLAHLQAL